MRYLNIILLVLLSTVYTRAQHKFVKQEGDTLNGEIVLEDVPLELTPSLNIAGQRMKNAAFTGYVGGAFLFLGGAGTAIGSLLLKDDPTNNTGHVLKIAGGGAMAVGGMITITAFIPIESIGRKFKGLRNKKPPQ